MIHVQDRMTTYSEQLKQVFGDFVRVCREDLSGAQPVFVRVFLSDSANQSEELAGYLQDATYAVSVIEQPPLDGSKIALWAYLQTDMQPFASPGELRAFQHNSYTHWWGGDMTAVGADSEGQTYDLLNRSEEVCQGQDQYEQIYGDGGHEIQVSSEDMEKVDLYMQCVGVPARRDVDDPVVQLGEQKFIEAGCNLCHLPTLHTSNKRTVLINGSELPWLCGQTIHPYSDYLLHDMGPELNDHYPSGLAAGYEWRTTPLWGIGLQAIVNGHTQFLHDGRARNLVEAIMWHGGEGAASREKFRRMKKSDRDALIRFVESL